MINHLEQLKKARATGLSYPALVQDTDLTSVFRMLDPVGLGYITYAQYSSSKIQTFNRKYEFLIYFYNSDGKSWYN